MSTKICSKCNQTKSINNFRKQRGQCNPCLAIIRKNSPVRKISEKLYSYNNKDKQKIRSDKCYIKYKDSPDFKKRKREYRKERYHSDPNFRMTICLRSRIYEAIKDNTKSGSTLDLLGCSVDFLKEHLKNKFKPHKITGKKMSFDNYGEWEIDHRLPCSSFDMTDPEEQRKCFHYTNLQPLWAEDNLEKSDKIIPEYK